MSKIIKMTPEHIDEIRQSFEKALENAKLMDGKITFTKVFSAEKAEAILYFTAEAWTKLVVLINEFSKEVAWHGSAKRVEDEENAYIIEDILVYPQTVSGTSVEMDTEKYANWIQENYEDERFYNIKMQGHSHVNMAPTPSGVDLNHQEEIVSQLRDDGFYIFMIYNKSFKKNIKIYDMQKNILFEDSDIKVKIRTSREGLDDFIASAKSMVVERSYKPIGFQQGARATSHYSATQYAAPRTQVQNPYSLFENGYNGDGDNDYYGR